MIPQPLGQITKEVLEGLVEDKVTESKTLEYKERLLINTGDEKRKLLKIVSSFANTQGGDLVFGGIAERDQEGKPTGALEQLIGLEGFNQDHDLSRLESIINSCLAPKIPRFEFQPIEGFSSGPVLILRVHKSWLAPHMVTFNGDNRFFYRTNTATEPMSIDEIRSSFIQVDEIYRKISNFREERTALILADEIPETSDLGPVIVLHTVPLSFADPKLIIDVAKHQEVLKDLRPLGVTGWSTRFNFNGFMVYTTDENNKISSYVQFFRSGIIEVVSRDSIPSYNGGFAIPSVAFPKGIISSLANQIRVYSMLEIATPFVFIMTLLRARGVKLGVANHGFPQRREMVIEKENLTFPEIMIEDISKSPHEILRPLFDTLWQSCGFERCFHYDDEGNWNDPR